MSTTFLLTARLFIKNAILVKLKDFIADYSSARDRAAAFDERMTNAARQVSEDVADLVAMTTRLVMASMDVTCGSDASDIMFFVNGMGTVHESLASTPRSPEHFSQRICNLQAISSYSNRVDDLYASWPAIMSINATYGRYMLEPLLRFQKDSSQAYAIPDLGMERLLSSIWWLLTTFQASITQ